MKDKTMKSANSNKFAPDTGNGQMAGFTGAAPAEPGKVSTGGRSANTKFAPDTGNGQMAGFTGAKPAKPC